MALSNHLAQGGQTFLHKVRMLRQVLGLAFRLGLVVGILVFGSLMVINVPLHVYEHGWKLLEAKATVCVMGDNAQMQNEEGGWVYAKDRATHPGFIYNVTVYLPYHLKRSALYGGMALLGIMGLAFVYWSLKGRSDKRRKHLAGSQLVSIQELTRQLKRANKASDIVLGELPLVKDSETQHMLITGTTGSGKTNCFHTLLPQIRNKRQRVVIVDTTGEFVSRYYRPEKDLLLNPLDARSVAWHPWAECTEDYHYDELATNLIPHTGHDPFWINSARTVLTETLKVYARQGSYDIQGVLNILTVAPLKDLYRLLQHTKAAPLVDPASEKTALSIRSTLTAAITSLSYLKTTQVPFSIRQWVQSTDAFDDSWLFLAMSPEQRDALRPLITAWTSIAVKSLLGCVPNSTNRLWVCIDELPSLHKLPDLQLCLAEGRKYGAAVILGVQNIPQLEERYGSTITKTMIDLCSTKVLFRAASYEIAVSLSRALGEQEIMEVQEGISYGANDVRDGVNLSMLKQLKPIVTTHELMGLKNLEGYVMLPEFNAVTKIKLPYVVPSNVYNDY
ncbi:MAG: type IV secretion system DNA-binding domain-containing protein [Alphaproteobacteria bacterium]|nr:type IV secretion system DNA-binding domain-containing protein [Alphaproteobacteria bacterium]